MSKKHLNQTNNFLVRKLTQFEKVKVNILNLLQ